ncbi:MAG: hypothetical protein MJE66_09685 [Proteobacteria bacterium]|nr:hypothetical protein [Pseudomonadota bacterium]
MSTSPRRWRWGLPVLAFALGAGGDASAPGAYCRLPEPGQEPECLAPAKSQYGEFFAGVEAGNPDESALEDVEEAVARGLGEEAYWALSSLAYGYYRLSQRAAAAPDANPLLVARLERWNAILARSYREAPDDSAYRSALREAADDLHQRAPAVRIECADAEGQPAPCGATEALLRGLDAAGSQVGVQGALLRVLERLFGGEETP